VRRLFLTGELEALDGAFDAFETPLRLFVDLFQAPLDFIEV
jgi:hypothetical protein